ncbi:EF-hand domain [Macleaya cordata]|uniref:EF-hand domain n=1 Tax=Macleaya cordata TaxID=56857 RepID=A0A200Q1C5_MACCD|nr:EF-hand domain [Macleaya cordata]
MVSDGMEYYVLHDQSPFLIKETNSSEESAACEHSFGFLPCTNNLLGHLFLIVVYEYLLFLGERYICMGSELAFQILGTGIFGASAFQILGAFPEGMIVLVSGLSKSKETAQEKVFTGVGLLAGTTVLLLTLLWGTCVILGKNNFSNDTVSKDSKSSTSKQCLWYTKLRSYLTGYGITTDLETSYTARIMVLSVLPFIIVQVPEIILKLSSRRRIVIMFTLVVSVVFLLFYFIYQVFQPWIQTRRLEYVNCRHLMARVLQHVEEQAMGKLLTDDGKPNLPVIKRLFEKMDLDADNLLSSSEFKVMLLGNKSETKNSDQNDIIIEEVIKEFDLDSDHMISKDEFINGFAKWLAKSKHAITNQGSYSKNFLDKLYQEKMVEYAKNKYMMQEILRHFESNAIGKLLTDEGTPNLPIIQRLFEKFDLDGDNRLSHLELKELIQGIKFGKIDLNIDDAVEELIEELDTDGDHMINRQEFVDGFTKYLGNKSHNETTEETDKVGEEGMSSSMRGTINKSPKTGFKAGLLLMLGIGILALLAEPLIEVVQDFSDAAHLPSFFVSFILLPLATNSRRAASAIKSARRLAVLLLIVYVRDLEWDFSAEVLVVLTITVVMGLLSSFCTKFPLWTSLVAYVLYPLSLVMVYVLNYVFQWH